MSQDPQRTNSEGKGADAPPSRFSTPKGRRKMILWIAIPALVVIGWLIYIVNAFSW